MEDKLFSIERLRQSSSTDTRTSKQQFESDRGRVLFSSPLRRLQSKAQVFSLESNAAVRSRLTHSIEVAHVGRYIAQQLVLVAEKEKDSQLLDKFVLIEPIVETACLLHDIGNPPFGHLGEKAIQEWFRDNSNSIHKKSKNNDIDKSNSYYNDFINFDGNPQGARIAITLQGFPDQKGLNLTVAQIGAIIKYPQFSDELSKGSSKYKKIAAFSSEKEILIEAWKKLGLKWGQRHPLVYLMEASDDIAYSLSDIEDGIEKTIITESEVIAFLEDKFSAFQDEIKNCIPKSDSAQCKVVGRFVGFRTNMINLLTKYAAEYFFKNREDFCAGTRKSIFDNSNDDDYSKALNIINNYCREKLYESKEAEDIEIAGYNIVHGLLDKFSLLLSLEQKDFKDLVDGNGKNNLERRMFSKLPKSLVDHYKYSVDNDPDNEWFIRFQLIVDYISGMTDDFSLKLYRLFHGIEVNIV
ncbi:dGTPase [Amphritea opalescens]|uniref:dGTPase n=1 Tax=Amphritea opalescens TaxID=2490544 RepID=A0A430KMA4_9GAMM|nr:dGTPase [Amphritea opalescens]RTE64493.1 dGTPase [Amphritea opalescens]